MAVVGTGLALVAHPVLVIGGYACIVSGFWFLMVNRVARRKLGRQRQAAQHSGQQRPAGDGDDRLDVTFREDQSRT